MTTINITLVLDDQHQIDAVTKALKDGGKGVRALVKEMYQKGTADTDLPKFAQYKTSIQILDALAARYADAVQASKDAPCPCGYRAPHDPLTCEFA
jgi:hypothetical protein